jgi:hypothetical protein
MPRSPRIHKPTHKHTSTRTSIHTRVRMVMCTRTHVCMCIRMQMYVRVRVADFHVCARTRAGKKPYSRR